MSSSIRLGSTSSAAARTMATGSFCLRWMSPVRTNASRLLVRVLQPQGLLYHALGLGAGAALGQRLGEQRLRVALERGQWVAQFVARAPRTSLRASPGAARGPACAPAPRAASASRRRRRGQQHRQRHGAADHHRAAGAGASPRAIIGSNSSTMGGRSFGRRSLVGEADGCSVGEARWLPGGARLSWGTPCTGEEPGGGRGRRGRGRGERGGGGTRSTRRMPAHLRQEAGSRLRARGDEVHARRAAQGRPCLGGTAGTRRAR